MKIWDEFLDGYRAARAAHRTSFAAPDDAGEADGIGPEWEPSHGGACETSEHAQLRRMYDACAAELAECRLALAELAAQAEELRADLIAARRGSNTGSGDEKFHRLARIVQRFVHPDRAGQDERLAAALEGIFKELRAEIEKIERGA